MLKYTDKKHNKFKDFYIFLKVNMTIISFFNFNSNSFLFNYAMLGICRSICSFKILLLGLLILPVQDLPAS